jgi:hypothetical protein
MALNMLVLGFLPLGLLHLFLSFMHLGRDFWVLFQVQDVLPGEDFIEVD